MNESLFEATAVALDNLTDKELDALVARKEQLLDIYTNVFKDARVFESVTWSTGDPTRVEKRFEGLRRVFAEVLQ